MDVFYVTYVDGEHVDDHDYYDTTYGDHEITKIAMVVTIMILVTGPQILRLQLPSTVGT